MGASVLLLHGHLGPRAVLNVWFTPLVVGLYVSWDRIEKPKHPQQPPYEYLDIQIIVVRFSFAIPLEDTP